MNRALILGAALLAWTLAVFFVGYQVRDGKADAVVATIATVQQTARADAAIDARSTDHVNAQQADKVEQVRVQDVAKGEATFQIIEREVVRYVQSNPDPAGCELDGDGLHAWRQANAGSVDVSP